MYILSELPTDLNKQGSPMIPPPAWFGPGITWDLPVRAVKSSGLGKSGVGQPGAGELPSDADSKLRSMKVLILSVFGIVAIGATFAMLSGAFD